jgi:predicted nicotinamide N-methyase
VYSDFKNWPAHFTRFTITPETGIVLAEIAVMKAHGYCHFNENDENRSFSIKLFDQELVIEQDPGSRDLGHGAVVWDAAVVFSKYMEKNYKDYDVQKLGGKTVLELGSGCGLGGIAFMMKGSKVTFTDLENVVDRLTEKNVQVTASI